MTTIHIEPIHLWHFPDVIHHAGDGVRLGVWPAGTAVGDPELPFDRKEGISRLDNWKEGGKYDHAGTRR